MAVFVISGDYGDKMKIVEIGDGDKDAALTFVEKLHKHLAEKNSDGKVLRDKVVVRLPESW